MAPTHNSRPQVRYAPVCACAEPTSPPEEAPTTLDIHIVRSKRRKKTVSAKLLNWYTLEISVPADISDAELAPILRQFEQQALAKLVKQRRFASNEDLERRAQTLNRELFGGSLRWRSIRFVGNQQTLFGSCTPGKGTIRLSNRLLGTPDFVIDYVLAHEMAHLVQPHHDQAFWDLVNRYPLTERARGYLMALGLSEDAPDAE